MELLLWGAGAIGGFEEAVGFGAGVEGRGPRLGSVMAFAALGMIVYALVTKPGGYAFNQVPGVMVKVIAGYFQ